MTTPVARYRCRTCRTELVPSDFHRERRYNCDCSEWSYPDTAANAIATSPLVEPIEEFTEFSAPPPRVVDLACGRSPFPDRFNDVRDEWLCEQFEMVATGCELAGSEFDHRHVFSFSGSDRAFSIDEYRHARSRVLAAKVAASDAVRRERDRRMVLCPIDDPDEV
jgi:hypothetical protein